jgi:hypothetical protein
MRVGVDFTVDELIDEWNAEVLFLLVSLRLSPLGFPKLYVCIRPLDIDTTNVLFGCPRLLADMGSMSVFSLRSQAYNACA